MIWCGDCREWMAEALYGEFGEARMREFESHVRECAECAALHQSLHATLETMSRRHRPDPGAEFWDGYWQRLEERAARENAVVDASRVARRRTFASWGYRAAAAALVLAAGVWIGRSALAPERVDTEATPGVAMAPAPPPESVEPFGVGLPPGEIAKREPVAPETDAAVDAPAHEPAPRAAAPGARTGETVLAAAGPDEEARRYLERSQVLLLMVLNAGDNGGVQPAGYSAEREQAGTLVAEGRKLQDELAGRDDRRLRELVGQLDMILREIANLEADGDLEAVEMIRNRVDREGVLLRIDLEQMRESSPPAERAKGARGAID